MLAGVICVIVIPPYHRAESLRTMMADLPIILHQYFIFYSSLYHRDTELRETGPCGEWPGCLLCCSWVLLGGKNHIYWQRWITQNKQDNWFQIKPGITLHGMGNKTFSFMVLTKYSGCYGLRWVEWVRHAVFQYAGLSRLPHGSTWMTWCLWSSAELQISWLMPETHCMSEKFWTKNTFSERPEILFRPISKALVPPMAYREAPRFLSSCTEALHCT